VSVRKVKEGETTNDIFAFLVTEPNAEVGAIQPKAGYALCPVEQRDDPHLCDKPVAVDV
jgi:hypothetical protein